MEYRYHFDGSRRPFFEGWYFKVAIPETRQSFCFMYTVENPAFTKQLSALEILENGPLYTGTGVQILGADDKYICQHSKESGTFWGSKLQLFSASYFKSYLLPLSSIYLFCAGTHELILGNTFMPKGTFPPPDREVPPQEFNRRVSRGFQVTPLWNQGSIQNDGK